jgi:hypothetical protein
MFKRIGSISRPKPVRRSVLWDAGKPCRLKLLSSWNGLFETETNPYTVKT